MATKKTTKTPARKTASKKGKSAPIKHGRSAGTTQTCLGFVSKYEDRHGRTKVGRKLYSTAAAAETGGRTYCSSSKGRRIGWTANGSAEVLA